MKRPRILFLAPKAPYPLTSGLAMREFHLLRAYSTIASVELAFFASDEKQYAEVANGVGSYCERIHALPYSQAPRTRLIPWPGWRSIAYPALTRSFDSSALQRLVASVVDSIDLIHVGRLHLARSVEVLKTGQGRRPRLILDL